MIKTDVVIVGAGPVGLFAVHQLGIKGLKSASGTCPRQGSCTLRSWQKPYHLHESS